MSMKLSRKLLVHILFIVGFYSCTKSVDVDPLNLNKSYLTGPSKARTWQLDSYLINSLPQTLTLSQKRYSKTFQYSGQFTDADGSSGKWQMPILDSLVEKYENFPSGTPAVQGYKIISISNQNLILQYVINGTTFTTTYKAL